MEDSRKVGFSFFLSLFSLSLSTTVLNSCATATTEKKAPYRTALKVNC